MSMKLIEISESDIEIPERFVKDRLNPSLWIKKDRSYFIKPGVRKKLLDIADEFYESLEIDQPYEDIYLIGSMASYNWTDNSDIDLHLVFDYGKVNKNHDLVEKYFDIKKKYWNDNHEIKIYDYDVELGCQELGAKFHSKAVFSIKDNKWISIPEKENLKVDKDALKSKLASIITRFEEVEKIKDVNDFLSKSKTLKDRIKKMRKSGLEKGGEFSIENLAFKYLRNEGYIERLFDLRRKALDNKLSMGKLNEGIFNDHFVETLASNKNIDLERLDLDDVVLGFNLEHDFFQNTNIKMSAEGILSTVVKNLSRNSRYYDDFMKKNLEKDRKKVLKENLTEKPCHTLIIKKGVDNIDEVKLELLRKFISFVSSHLKLKEPCKIFLSPIRNKHLETTASYNRFNNNIWIYVKNRNMLGDILRSLAHEMMHFKQNIKGELNAVSGEDGSPQENEANSFSGVMIRKFGRENRKIYD